MFDSSVWLSGDARLLKHLESRMGASVGVPLSQNRVSVSKDYFTPKTS